MKAFAAALVLVALLLQYRLWLASDGVREVGRLKEAVSVQRALNGTLDARNRQLSAEVSDLKRGMRALEERARSELGMIGREESFFQVVPRSIQAPTEARTRTAQR
jgi:cell division protein FtsB